VTCGPESSRFRILGPDMHWSFDLVATGEVEIGEVIRLRPTTSELDEIIDRHFFPPGVARGCGPCDWYLVVADPACPRRGLLHLVDDRWCEVRPAGCRLALEEAVAVATAGERIAVLDAGRAEIVVVSRGARRIIRTIPFTGRGPIALGGTGVVYAAAASELVAFDRSGDELHRIDVGVPITRLTVGDCGDLWIVTEQRTVWRWNETGFVQLAGELSTALASLPKTQVTQRGDHFCITVPRGTAAPHTSCFDRCGRPVDERAVPVASHRTGTAQTTAPLDSFMPRCRWHRLRLDADVPVATSIGVEVATTETLLETPHASDWQQVRDAATDFLFDQPAGRYLHLRITLASHADTTPVLRSIRLDFPRSTSAEWLPAVYRDAPESRDFLDRFLAIFDATLEELDRAIERFPAMLDPRHAPERVLPWVGSLVGMTLDASWPLQRRRALLERLPDLYRRRGTPAGVQLAIEAITGVTPVIEELNAPSPFGTLSQVRARRVPGGARVGEVRLFGRGRARVRLGSSALGATQLKSYGDPDDDARSALAFRVRVQLPATTEFDTARLERLVATQMPAHVVASVRVGEQLAAVGRASAVGIDTILSGLPRPILGTAGNVRLRRRSALWPGASRGDAVIAVGRGAAVGMQTILR